MKSFFHSTLKPLILALILSFGMSYAYAGWTAPSAVPPGGNIDVPVNTGNAAQVKSGSLGTSAILTNSLTSSSL